MKLFILPAVILLLSISSCKQAPVEYVHSVDTLYIRDTLHVPDTNAWKLKGTLHGEVGLYSYLGPVSDYSGIRVTLEGTPFHAITDSSGSWAIRDLPTGTYNISYDKEGFDSYKIYWYQFVGGGDVKLMIPYGVWGSSFPVWNETPLLPLSLDEAAAVSNFRTVKFTDCGSASQCIYFDGQTSVRSVAMQVDVYFGRDSMVSSDNHVYSATSYIDTLTGKFLEAYSVVHHSQLVGFFKSKDRVCMVAYLSYMSKPHYWVPGSNQWITLGNGRNRSNVASFVLR